MQNWSFNMDFEKMNKLMIEGREIILTLHAENQKGKEIILRLHAENQKLNEKIDKMLDHIVSLTDDLFAERRECIKLEDEIKDLKEQLLEEQWKNADADI